MRIYAYKLSTGNGEYDDMLIYSRKYYSKKRLDSLYEQVLHKLLVKQEYVNLEDIVRHMCSYYDFFIIPIKNKSYIHTLSQDYFDVKEARYAESKRKKEYVFISDERLLNEYKLNLSGHNFYFDVMSDKVIDYNSQKHYQFHESDKPPSIFTDKLNYDIKNMYLSAELYDEFGDLVELNISSSAGTIKTKILGFLLEVYCE
ncbi:hypothetical protein EBB07_28645 [Paenibacillaceae bacterium]|nr:hypothetical protein EBB07_28645 [Paenibacillaceae bacterium]